MVGQYNNKRAFLLEPAVTTMNLGMFLNCATNSPFTRRGAPIQSSHKANLRWSRPSAPTLSARSKPSISIACNCSNLVDDASAQKTGRVFFQQLSMTDNLSDCLKDQQFYICAELMRRLACLSELSTFHLSDGTKLIARVLSVDRYGNITLVGSPITGVRRTHVGHSEPLAIYHPYVISVKLILYIERSSLLIDGKIPCTNRHITLNLDCQPFESSFSDTLN